MVGDGFAPLTINASPVPELRALADFGFYSVASPGGLELYTNFQTFREAVIERAGEPVFRVTAFGGFDPSTQVFSALTACVVFGE